MVNPNSPTNDGPSGDDDPGDYLIHDSVCYPRRIGSFTLRSFIGRGSFGLVFHAERSNPLKHVALKILRPDVTEEISIRRFVKEADHLAALDHDNIVQVFESGFVMVEGRTTPYFVTSLVEGASPINEYVINKRLEEAAKVRLIIKIARAAQQMHDRGMIHRDLKPSNVLVDSGGKPQIIDVGLVLTGDPLTRFEQLGTWCGSPPYMAPEQFDGPNNVTPRTDVYALGVILHELLTGRLPYDFPDRAGWEKIKPIIQHTPPTRPSDHVSLEHPELDDVVARALEKDLTPHDGIRRMKTAEDLAVEIERIVGVSHNSTVRGKPSAPSVKNGDAGQGDQPTPTRPLWKQITNWFRSHDMLRMFLVAAAVGMIAAVCGHGFAVSTSLARYYESRIHATPLPAVCNTPLRNVAVVRFMDEDEPVRVAKTLGIEGVRPPDFVTLRPLHAEVMRRLRPSRAAAIVPDIHFKSEHDEHIPELIEVAKFLGAGPYPIRVFAGFNTWRDSIQSPVMNRELHKHINGGGVTIDEGSHEDDSYIAAWTSEIALERGGNTYPGLPLAPIASIMQPSLESSIKLHPSRDELVIEFSEPSPLSAEKSPRDILKTSDPFRLYDIVTEDPTPADIKDFGIQPGDRIAKVKLALPPQPLLDQVSYSYEQVLAADRATLEDMFRGRAVFLANTVHRVGGTNDCYQTPDGRMLWGVYAHAIALEQLMSGRTIYRPAAAVRLLLPCAAAVIGSGGFLHIWRRLLGRPVAQRERRVTSRVLASAAVLAVGVSGLILGCFFTTRETLLYIQPFAAVSAFVGAAVAVLVFVRVRIRHEPHAARRVRDLRIS